MTTSCNTNTMTEVLEVYSPDYKIVHIVPLAKVSHQPSSHRNINRLMICRNYRAGEPESCTMGASCKFVHVEGNVEELPKQQIHVNYAWRAASLVTYERLSESGAPLRVAEPNTKEPTEEIECGHVLRTEGSTRALEAGAAASHCAHFRYNRVCNLGAACSDIHAIHIDPTAKDFQRAPSRKPAAVAKKPETSVATTPAVAEDTAAASVAATPCATAAKTAAVNATVGFVNDSFASTTQHEVAMPRVVVWAPHHHASADSDDDCSGSSDGLSSVTSEPCVCRTTHNPYAPVLPSSCYCYQ